MPEVFALHGRVYREPAGANRRTLRFELAGRGWFLKLHWGVGWGEIFKNLLSLRLPVLGAMNEWRAIRRLEALGVETMQLAACGREGLNPARLRSFVITAELADSISLEDYCADWPGRAPQPREKWALIRRVAQVARILHRNGVNHRDFYLCHFMLRRPWDGTAEDLRLPLIDLHRVQLRRRTPWRWRVKDLGSLYFSAMQIGLTRRDLLRFVREYTGYPLRQALQGDPKLWRGVEQRARALDATRPPPKAQAGAPVTLELTGTPAPLTKMLPVRVLPGRRLVTQGLWQGRAVFAKVFQEPRLRRRRRHFQRELSGLQALHRAGIPAPDILYSGASLREHWPVLLLQAIEPARPLLEAWNRDWDATQRRYWLGRLVDLLARLHGAGLVQADLHLGNFLISGDQLYTLDGDAIRAPRGGVGRSAALDNLALLFAQLYPEYDTWLDELLPRYVRGRGWADVPALVRFERRVRRLRERRCRKFLEKTLRTCSEFQRQDNPYGMRVVDRQQSSEALWQWLGDPDASCPAREALLKNGNTSSVWVARVNGRPLVVKRYNVKGFWHGLKLSLRAGRAVASWRNAYRLGLYGILTPRPVALAKHRCERLRPLAWLVTEWLPGPNALEWFKDPGVPWAEKREMARQIADLFRALRRERIRHGDTKATNIIISDRGPALVDLDAMRRYRTPWAFARAWRADMMRFARNWQADPALARLFAGVMADL
jgi:heptose I phosphotransferase